jgi:uncharacterized protein (DUF1330 family)
VIYLDDILDEARYQNFPQNVVPNIAAASGKYKVRGGNTELLEGQCPAGRTVILEFLPKPAAFAW